MNSDFRADTLQDAIDALARLGCKPTKTGDGYTALCPIHEADGKGHNPSLTLKAGDTHPVVVNCHAGCDGREILKALGINGTAHKSASIIAVYRYQTSEGRDVREKLRYQPKDFRIRHRDAAGSWVYKAGDGPPVLYRLPEVKAAIAEGRTVFICEGEKDCDLLANAGLVATTNIEGAAKPEQRPKWKREYTAQLSGAARVILLPDNDEPGRAHMAHIAAQLAGKVADLRWLALPGLPPKGDVSDWLNAGHSIDEFKALVATAPQPVERDAERPRMNDEASQPGKRREQLQVPDDRPSSYSAIPSWRTELMTRGDSEQLQKNHYNAVVIVENAYPGLVGYNEFRQRIEARTPSPWRKEPGQWTDADTGELAFAVARHFASFTLDALAAAVMTVAHRHPFNPAQERLRALAGQWDGENRLNTWLIDYFSAANDADNAHYLREIGAAWLKGVTARVLIPGCKRDDVLVLRSEQGYLKSTAAQAIADAIHPDAFTDNLGDLGHKDARAGIRGIIIAELGELAALNKSDIESVKAFVAARSDHFREAYGRGERDYPRTVSFIGTTNDPTFLKDPSGNRRWWPVTVTDTLDISRLEAALPQLLGEAAQRVLSGEPWYVKDALALQQADAVRAAHFAHDVWTEAVLNAAELLLNGGTCPRCKGSGYKSGSSVPYKDDPGRCYQCDGNGTLDGANAEFVTIAAILNAMGIRLEQQTIPNATRVGGVLRVNHWTDKRKRVGPRKEGRMVVAWYPPNLVHPKTGCNHRVQPVLPTETVAVHPVAPGSPYFVGGVEMGGGSTVETGVNADHAPRVQDFIGNTLHRVQPGEPLGKWRANLVAPGGSPSKQGEPETPVEPPADALSTHLGSSSKPVDCKNSAPPGRSTQAHPVATDPKARRILEQLRAMPAGVTDEELKRAVCTDKGTSPALVDLILTRLAKARSIGKVNGRWVLMGNRP